MAVKIITGSIGSGKTRYCIDEISKVHKSDPSRRCIMLVPSHYSHETEHMLITEFGGTGLNNIECTSFEKMARELISDTSKRLGASGKHVLICRAITLTLKTAQKDTDKLDRRLIRAVSKRGFIDVAASLISELHRYNVTPETVLAYSQSTENPLLSQKLHLLSLIAENYEKLLESTDYTDCDDDLSRLAKVIGNSITNNDSIWLDKFDEFLPQQLEVVKALIMSGADITITFNTCRNSDDTYYATKKAIEDIRNFTAIEMIHLDGEMSHVNAPDLRFLFESWFDRDVYSGKCENIEIFAARDAYTETEHVASKILDLVREDKYRFYNMGILCPNGYSHIIEAVFDEYDIPYYTDERIAISEYPIAMQILSLFDIIEHNWNYDSMFEYLRAGFVYTKTRTESGKTKFSRLNPDDIDLLENYVLRYGIEYKNAWCRSWLTNSRGIIDTAFEKDSTNTEASQKLDDLRATVIAPIINYSEAVKASETVSDYCRALFAFLEDINLYQGLKNELLSMAINNATADAQRFGQIWNLILDVLDQVNTALGDEEATHEEFAQYIISAMEQCQIRTVPSGIDRVFIGNTDMNRAIPTPVVFAMGAVSGTFPQLNASEGFLSNADRITLSENNLRLAPTTVKKAEKQYNTVYKLLSATTDKLYISYPSMTADGASNLPSQLVTDIKDKFCDLHVIDDILAEDSDILHISSPKPTLHKFLINPSEHPLWSHVDAWFNEHEEWRNRLFSVKKAKRNFSYRKIELNEDIAQDLYSNKNRYSATRLNSYANCPFSHFLRYGLDAREREEYDIKPTDTGTYAHEIIRRFCTRIDEDENLSWHSMDDEKCTGLVSEIVADTLDKINASELRDKEMTADILSRMGETVTEAAKTVCRSINCGEFEIDSYEKEILVKLNDNIEIGGIIDRLDVCRLPDRNEYRIIDYKTGHKDFSVADIYHGLDMQPVIYALAMRILDDKATISGMYYSMVHNSFASIGVTSGEKSIDTALRKNTEYNGITFVGDDKNSPIPQEEIDRIESELSRADGSLFFTGKKNELGYSKSVKSRSEGEWLMGRVRDNIINADKDIRNGNIAITPLVRGGNSACTYCAYRQVCRFDESVISERCITDNDSDIWNKSEEDA
ncbi:MAG: exodeoxyribonuclease V subunit gamma [Clostridia bacterium]|nr:exodeoxyribonuclease V subunit gamma [Clostridia bacterium]